MGEIGVEETGQTMMIRQHIAIDEFPKTVDHRSAESAFLRLFPCVLCVYVLDLVRE